MLEQFGVINLWTYIIGSIFIILVLGPNSIFVFTTGIKFGVKKGYQASLGIFLGDAILNFAAFIGVAPLMQAFPIAFSIIKYVGAAYIVYLGLRVVYFTLKVSTNDEQKKEEPARKGSSFKKALLLSLTNPKAILFIVSFFVQFIDPTTLRFTVV